MPSVLKISYNTPQHNQIKLAILARYQLSQRKMQDKWKAWQDSEKDFEAYIPETDANALRRDAYDAGTPQQLTFVVPYSYAILMTAHMYWSTVFLNRTPVLQYAGRHGEAQDVEMKIEALMDYQVQTGRHLVPLTVWIMDAAKYGLGVVCSYWDEEQITVSQIEEVNETYLGIPIPGKKKKVRQQKTLQGYVGNKLFNVRPYDFIFDPRVPIMEIQRGEFCGRKVELGWNEILRKEAQGLYFNIDRLRTRRYGQREDPGIGSPTMVMPTPEDQAALSQSADSGEIPDVGFVPAYEMYIELIPNDWGLGSSKIPEKWYFLLADRDVIICARPQGSYHNKYPYFIQEYEIDGYQLAKRSMLDILRPLNETITWLIDSHYKNVRKVINDQFVIDPSKLVMSDVLNPSGGRMWRLRPEAYGTDPKMAVAQLQVVDVTQNNIRDAGFIGDLMQRISGVSDNVMGFVNQGGRKTATEVRSSNTLGINRLKAVAEYNSALGWGPYAQVTLQETQQRYDMERKFKVAGVMSMDPSFAKFVDITPDDIQGFFDFIPVDGTMPIDRFAMASVNKELLVDTAKIPGMAQQIDYVKWLGYIAELQGARNFDRFRIQVAPDQTVAAQAAAGNVVPIGGQGGTAIGRGTAGTPNVGSVPGAPQIAGMGPSG